MRPFLSTAPESGPPPAPDESATPPTAPDVRTRFIPDVPIVGRDEPIERPLPEPPALPGYEVRGVLGHGGMGVVYEAHDPRLKRRVALKMLLDGAHASARSLERFRAEAEAIARLQHPNIVQIYEVGGIDGRPFFAMELVEGGSLADRLERGPLPAAEAVRLVAVLAHAVDHAHRRGVLHRDLKPGNILFGHDGGPKVTDFGLAKQLDANPGWTRSGAVVGTPGYMAPEQARSEKVIGPAADVWALGAILYECLTGRPPFVAETAWDTIVAVVTEEPVPPSRRQPRLARDLDTVCLRALAKDPRRRYPSAEELARDLDRFAAGETILARPEGALRRAVRRARRHPVVAGAAALLLAAVMVGGGYYEQRRSAVKVALDDAAKFNQQGQYDLALERVERGRELLGHLPWHGTFPGRFDAEAARANRGLLDQTFRAFTEEVRFRYDADDIPPAARRELESRCRTMWANRHRVAEAADEPSDRLREDLLELALLWSRLAPAGERGRILGEAESLCGRRARPDDTGPQTAWEFSVRGRARLAAKDLDGAAADFRRAVELEPGAFWHNFYRGACAYRAGEPDEALVAFSVCVALWPREAKCYYHRALAHAARGELDEALADYGRAVERNPRLAEARLNRGLLLAERKRYREAVADLESALAAGLDAAAAHYNLAAVHLAAGDRAAARRHVSELLRIEPRHAEGLALRGRIAPP